MIFQNICRIKFVLYLKLKVMDNLSFCDIIGCFLNNQAFIVIIFEGKQLDFRQLDFQVSRSSTTMSDVQESEDNFWLEQVWPRCC